MEAVKNHLVWPGAGLIRLLCRLLRTRSGTRATSPGYPPGSGKTEASTPTGYSGPSRRWPTWDSGRGLAAVQYAHPINHSRTPLEAGQYKVEPYVTSADVYASPDHMGRGGWTWYTGSAPWMYRVGLEWILGLHREKDRLWIRPCVPREWPGYQICYRYGQSLYRIEVINGDGIRPYSVELDGVGREQDFITLTDDGAEHVAVFRM